MSVYKVNNKPLPIRRTVDPTSKEQKAAFEKKMRNASEMYEKQFLRQMVKSMRDTVTHSKYTQPTMAEKIYLDKTYDQYVESWAKQGGVGFGDIIYNQLVERYSPYHRKNLQKPVGPLPVNQKPKGFEIKPQQGNKINIQMEDAPRKNGSITNPWQGDVIQVKKSDENRVWLKLQHENGMKSDISFKGSLGENIELGQSLKAGHELGKRNADYPNILWTIDLNQKS